MNKDRLKKLEMTSHKILSDLIFEETSEILVDFWIITITERRNFSKNSCKKELYNSVKIQ